MSNNFTIKINPDSTNDIVQLNLEIDGGLVKTFNSPPFEYSANLSDGVHKLGAKAVDSKNNQSDRIITIGVNVPWDYTPSPTPTIIPSPTPTIIPSPTV